VNGYKEWRYCKKGLAEDKAGQENKLEVEVRILGAEGMFRQNRKHLQTTVFCTVHRMPAGAKNRFIRQTSK